MKPFLRILLVLSLAAAFAGCKTTGDAAQAQAPEPSLTAAGSVDDADDAYKRENAVTVTATVEAIDHATRQVTLLGPDGKKSSFKVGEQVRNLAQVQKGDTVQLTYYQAVMVAVKEPGEALPGVSMASGVERAQTGAMPGAIGANSITVVATVRALDREQSTATLDLGNGDIRTIAVRDPSHYDRVKVGDMVEITYTEALAIGVEKTGAR
jgi:hypothetical protein